MLEKLHPTYASRPTHQKDHEVPLYLDFHLFALLFVVLAKASRLKCVNVRLPIPSREWQISIWL